MQVLATGMITDRATEEQVAPCTPAEQARGGELYRQGSITRTWRRGDRSRLVMLLDRVDAATAEDGLSSPPPATAGLTSYQFVPLHS